MRCNDPVCKILPYSCRGRRFGNLLRLRNLLCFTAIPSNPKKLPFQTYCNSDFSPLPPPPTYCNPDSSPFGRGASTVPEGKTSKFPKNGPFQILLQLDNFFASPPNLQPTAIPTTCLLPHPAYCNSNSALFCRQAIMLAKSQGLTWKKGRKDYLTYCAFHSSSPCSQPTAIPTFSPCSQPTAIPTFSTPPAFLASHQTYCNCNSSKSFRAQSLSTFFLFANQDGVCYATTSPPIHFTRGMLRQCRFSPPP